MTNAQSAYCRTLLDLIRRNIETAKAEPCGSFTAFCAAYMNRSHAKDIARIFRPSAAKGA